MSQYRVVVGLGNPGSRYDGTRHNIGFAVLDALRSASVASDLPSLESSVRILAADAIAGRLSSLGWSDRRSLLESSVSQLGEQAILVKPQTFMNRSGEPLQQILSFKKIPIEQVIVVHDEIDLPVGTLRVKVGGGEGGHNGLRSISQLCGGRGYARVRIGVGKPPAGSPLVASPDGIATWVLSRYAPDELHVIEELIGRAAAAILSLIKDGLDKTQRLYNR